MFEFWEMLRNSIFSVIFVWIRMENQVIHDEKLQFHLDEFRHFMAFPMWMFHLSE